MTGAASQQSDAPEHTPVAGSAALGHLLSAGAQREPKRVTSKPAVARV